MYIYIYRERERDREICTGNAFCFAFAFSPSESYIVLCHLDVRAMTRKLQLRLKALQQQYPIDTPEPDTPLEYVSLSVDSLVWLSRYRADHFCDAI